MADNLHSEEGSSDVCLDKDSHISSEYSDRSTTDSEDELTHYWEGLKTGVMSHPASLQLQCLLYIIGHIKFEPPDDIDLDEHIKYLPVSCLGLLPRSIRNRLLCLLPAIDVAKLEGTPVTIGISMDEICEYIFNERLPLHHLHVKKKIEIWGYWDY
uniref:Uncharacterized protein n=1 Tax=Amphimedon queenslandica TaxID=400682 RepID=A0A1X7TSL1_AMPQE